MYKEFAQFIMQKFKEESENSKFVENNIHNSIQPKKMALVSLKEHLQGLIENAQIEDALKTFLEWSKQNDEKDLINNLILLNSRFYSLQKNINIGLIDDTRADMGRNQIVHALNSYIDEIPKNARIEIVVKIFIPIVENEKRTYTSSTAKNETNKEDVINQQSVFISYNHKDVQLAEKIKHHLLNEKIKVVIDSDNLGAGEDIKGFIEDNVRKNSVVLSVVSTNSLMSSWVAMESVNTLYAQKVSDKKFIAACIDSSFFKRSFVDDALNKIEDEIQDIKETITKRLEKGRNITDLQNELARFMNLQHNLPNIVQRLKESLSVDVSGDNFEKGMRKIIASIA